jgi:NhaA family Na+:H+ antiporter
VRLRRLTAVILDNSLLLVGGTVAALAWANLAPASYERVSGTLRFAVNDVAMVFFFGLAAKEIVEATRPGGPLASPREAAVPLLAAAAGMIVPAVLYVSAAFALERPDLYPGWATPCATDIAFSYMAARLIFPKGHPAIPFLLLLAVADDALGLLILAAFYPAHDLSMPALAAGLVSALAVAWSLRHWRVKSFWPYVLAGGGLSWAGFYAGGLHPALALIPIVPFMRVEKRYHPLFEDVEPRTVDTLNVFADRWRSPVQIILFFFGLTNAGVPLHHAGQPTWIVLGALLAGKPLGIVLMTAIAELAGLRRPRKMQLADVALVGMTAAIGFTVALFFAAAAFPPGRVLDEVKTGALLSFVAAPLAVVGSRHRRRRRRPA